MVEQNKGAKQDVSQNDSALSTKLPDSTLLTNQPNKSEDNEIKMEHIKTESGDVIKTEKRQNCVEDKETEQSNCDTNVIKPEADATLSKRQRKKLAKRQAWIDSKADRRKEERLRKKRKMEKYREERGGFAESRSASRKRVKRNQVPMADSSCKVGVVFDMQFGNLMHQRDLGKCLKQILRSYSNNRRLQAPLQMYMTSLEGVVLEEMSKHDGYRAWDMQFHETNFIDVLPKESLVYLTSDSENSLETLENGKNYIIGGLVDHNNHKGLCFRKAKELGIAHARLPIDAFLEMKTRHVLAVNHVYEIMAQVTESKSWKDAFNHTIPNRKGAVDKTIEDGDENSATEDAMEEDAAEDATEEDAEDATKEDAEDAENEIPAEESTENYPIRREQNVSGSVRNTSVERSSAIQNSVDSSSVDASSEKDAFNSPDS